MKIYFNHKEELWNSWSHSAGIIPGTRHWRAFLVWCGWARNGWATAGIILYLFGMLSSYVASTVYHALSAWSPWKQKLRRWDHAAIYWIAGSLLAHNARGSARVRHVGMGVVHIHLGGGDSRNGEPSARSKGTASLKLSVMWPWGLAFLWLSAPSCIVSARRPWHGLSQKACATSRELSSTVSTSGASCTTLPLLCARKEASATSWRCGTFL